MFRFYFATLVIFLLCSPAKATEIEINPGQSILVTPSESTKVSCRFEEDTPAPIIVDRYCSCGLEYNRALIRNVLFADGAHITDTLGTYVIQSECQKALANHASCQFSH